MFSRNGFSSNIIKLVSGSLVAQALLLLASPILTRYYTPEYFGLYSVFVSIVGILASISCLQVENAIVLPEQDHKAVNLLAASLLIALIFSGVMVPVALLAGPPLARLLNLPDLGNYLWLIPLITFFGGTTLGHPALNFWNTRTKRFGRVSITQVINTVIVLGIQLTAGFLGWASGGSLIMGACAGSIISTSFLLFMVLRESGGYLRANVSLKEMLTGIQRYRKFPIYDTWATLLNSISWQLPVFILSIFFSPAVVGFYSLGNSVLRTPMNILSSSISQVFFQRGAEAKIQGDLAAVVVKVFRLLVMLGLFPMLMFMLIGKDIFAVVFGSAWTDSGVYVQVLSIWMLFWFITSPLSVVFRILEKQNILLGLNVLIFSSRLISLLIGGYYGSITLALVLYAGTGVIVYGFLGYLIMAYSGMPALDALKILFKNFLGFVPFGVLFLLIKFITPNQLIHVLVAGCALLLYYSYMLLSRPEVRALFKKDH
jgi:lipopolysaccharide exporter